MRWKLFKAVALGAVLMCAPVGWNAVAADSAASEEYEKAIGLIEKCTLTCNVTGDGYINISAKTQVSSVMEEVGYKNVVVQRSDDGENWVDEVYIGDLVAQNTRYYSINNMRVKVRGGGEYRVVCDHYAKGVPFGEKEVRSQIATNSSSWTEQAIVTSANPNTTAATTTTTTTRTTPPTTHSTSKTTSSTSAKTTASTTSGRQSSSSALTSTTAAATTTAKSGTSQPKTDAPTTGAKSPAVAIAVLAGAGAAGWTVRKRK